MRQRTTLILAAFALLLGFAVSAGAQVTGLYYQEVVKDGRVYVFNTPETLKLWKDSGEMGKSITLIGRGEGGLTLVAENETAADLYLFKHNLPGYERPTPATPKSFDERVFYKDGKTNIVMKTGTVQISNRLQARFTETDPEVGDNVGSFRIRRMKTTIEGNFVDNTWKFKLQANWVGGDVVSNVSQAGNGAVTQTRARGPILEDASLWYAKNPLATIWVGQDKAYFGRQELTSSGRQQFVDRSITSDRFAASRQIGIGLTGQTKNKHFEYNLGLYNGEGINQTANLNTEFMYVGRAVWTPLGEVKLEESALDYPDTPRFALGASFLKNTTGPKATAVDIDRQGAEVVFKYLGFNVVGEYYTETSSPKVGADLDTDGYYLQAGYLFPNKHFELATRLATVLPDTATPQDRTETGLGASWYWDKHTHKIQADYRQIEDDRTKAKDKELRIQLQLIF